MPRWWRRSPIRPCARASWIWASTWHRASSRRGRASPRFTRRRSRNGGPSSRRPASKSNDGAPLVLLLETDRGDDLAPLRLLGGEERRVVLRRAGGGDPADPGVLLDHRARAKRGQRGGMEPFLDLARRGGRHHQPVPVVGGDVGQVELGGGRR